MLTVPRTPHDRLIAAAQNGNNAEILAMRGAGVELHAKTEEALCLAASYGRTETVRLLNELGADIHAQHGGLLRMAAAKGQMNVVAVLLDREAQRVWGKYSDD